MVTSVSEKYCRKLTYGDISATLKKGKIFRFLASVPLFGKMSIEYRLQFEKEGII